jgi:hypothetical protein
MSQDDDPNRLIIGPDTVAETIDSAVTGGPGAEADGERTVNAESYAETIAELPSITESDDPPILSYGPKLGAGGKAVVRLAEQMPMGLPVLGGEERIVGTPAYMPPEALGMALAVALDLRLLWVGVVFLLVAPLQLRFPDYPRELAAGGVIVGTLLLAWSWWD